MLDRSEVGKRGYLHEDYRLFHLRDNRALQLDYHYHEFDKLVLQLGGRVTYNIEGKSYLLQPMDILLVSRNMIHLPVVDPEGTVGDLVQDGLTSQNFHTIATSFAWKNVWQSGRAGLLTPCRGSKAEPNTDLYF